MNQELNSQYAEHYSFEYINYGLPKDSLESRLDSCFCLVSVKNNKVLKYKETENLIKGLPKIHKIKHKYSIKQIEVI